MVVALTAPWFCRSSMMRPVNRLACAMPSGGREAAGGALPSGGLRGLVDNIAGAQSRCVGALGVEGKAASGQRQVTRKNGRQNGGHGPGLGNRSSRWRGLALAVVVALGGAGQAAGQGLPLIRDTEIEQLLNDYAQPIFKVAPNMGGGRVAVRIVRNESFNAFVMDGRSVFMHTGTLAQADTPNQVIGIIAHEVGHITGGHVAQMQARLARESTRMLLLRALGIGVAIATGRGEAIAAADEVVIRSFLAERRLQEGAADQAGLSFLTATRQSGRGMLETFERFAQQEYISDAQKDPFVRSHPVATARLQQLRDRVERSPFFNQKDPPELQLRHDLMRAKLAGYLDPPRTIENRYPQSDRSLPARYARAIGRFFRGGPGALEQSVAEVDALIRERPAHPYFYELKGDLLMRAGKIQDAIPPLRHALKLTQGANLIQVQLATALLATNDPAVVEEAATMLRKSLIGDQNSRGFRALADASFRQGKPAEAEASMAQAHMLEGDLKQAQIFAKRAVRGLTANSPLWIKMDDIINAKPPRDG
jgi:predicted Zn-dependent protease